jgi:hypothetical protein
MVSRAASLATLILLTAGCRARSTPDAAPEITPDDTAPGTVRRTPSNPCGAAPGRLCQGETLEARVLSIARDYTRYSKLDVMPRWAPMPCEPTWRPSPGDMYLSDPLHKGDPTDATMHARKLYYLYALDPEDYTRYQPPNVVQPGQIIVKEAFRAVEVTGVPDRDELPPAHARHGREVYRAGDSVGLFVMAKLDTNTEGTDEGWVYGVVAPGRAKVNAGKLETCMSCHRNAPRDRLFGFHR